jgi:hypothetical protein
MIMTIPVQLFFLGRVELDTLVAGYILAFATPIGTIGNSHLDQGLEYASFYYLKDVPPELRNHPRVLEWLDAKQTWGRLGGNLRNKTYENFQNFFQNTLFTLRFAVLGGAEASKGFVRAIFGGYLPAEVLLNGTQVVENAANGIPVAEQVAKIPNAACEFFLENNYSDGERLVPPVKK